MEILIEILRSSLPAAVPIMLAALGGLFTWHADVFNISMEGMLLISAFMSVLGSYLTESWVIGVLFGLLGSLVVSLLFSFFVLKMKTGQFITGIAINTFVLGLTTYMLRAIFNVTGSFIDPKIQGIAKLNIPFIEGIPFIGNIISGHSVLVYFSFIILVPLCYYLLYQTPFGLRLRASGYDKKVVDSIGINSESIAFKSILLSAILCGLGGSFLSLGFMTMFTENMSNGRGWIALAAIIVTKGHPIKVMFISLLFGLMEGIGLTVQQFNIPSQLTSMLPYISVLFALYWNSRTKNTEIKTRELDEYIKN